MSKQFMRIGRYLKYPIVFLIIITGTIFLVAYGQGYVYDRERGFISGGLILLDSNPANARVSVDGIAQGTTPRRVRRPVGQYDVELSRDGFRNWHKRVDVREGGVVNAEYPILIPTNVATRPISTIENPGHFSQSPNRSRLVYVEEGSPASLYLLPAGESEPLELFTLPPTYADFTVEDVVWSRNSRELILEVSNGAAREFFFVDTEDDRPALALNAEYDMNLEEVVFTADSDELAVRAGSELLILDVSSGDTTSLAEGVIAYQPGSSDSLYALIQRPDAIELARLEDGESQTLYRLQRDGEYQLYTMRYRGERTLVLHHLGLEQVTLLRRSQGEYESHSFAPRSAAEVSISPTQQFITMRKNDRFRTYDLRTERLHRFRLDGVSRSDISWYGTHHMLLSIRGSATMVEFDGANREPIASDLGLAVYGVRSEATIYSVRENTVTNRVILQRSLLE